MSKPAASVLPGLHAQPKFFLDPLAEPTAQAARMPGIHGLRGIAAVGVMFMHTAAIASLAMPSILGRIVPHLGLGVVLFFVVSAFSLLYSHERVAGKPGWMRAYFIKRVFRIAPLFWFMLCIYLWHPFYGPPATAGVIAANFLFVFNFIYGLHESLVPAGWTIGVEMPFYLMLPFVIDRIRGPRDATVFFALSAVVALAGRAYLTDRYGATSSYVGIAFFPNISDFAAGILAYHLVKARKGKPAPWLLVGVVGLALLATLPLQIPIVPFTGSRPDILLWAVVMGMITAWQAAAPSRALSTPVMQWLGERSFGIYLMHPLVIFSLLQMGAYKAIYGALEPIGPWAYLVCVALTGSIVMVAAAIVYRWIEVPGQKAGSRLIKLLDKNPYRSNAKKTPLQP